MVSYLLSTPRGASFLHPFLLYKYVPSHSLKLTPHSLEQLAALLGAMSTANATARIAPCTSKNPNSLCIHLYKIL